MMKRFWLVLSALCLIAAAWSLWARRTDAAFVLAALGAVAWFLDIRSGLRPATVEEPEEESDVEEVTDENEK